MHVSFCAYRWREEIVNGRNPNSLRSGKGTSLNSTSLTPKPLASSVYVHVPVAPSPHKRSISVMSHFPFCPFSPSLKILNEARIATAREILARDLERIQHTGGGGAGDSFAEIPSWSHRLMVDRMRIAATEAERLEAIREYRDRMRDLERLVGGYARTGQGRVSDSLKATYYRLEADQLLVEAGGQDASQVKVPDLPSDVRAMQPQSAPPTKLR